MNFFFFLQGHMFQFIADPAKAHMGKVSHRHEGDRLVSFAFCDLRNSSPVEKDFHVQMKNV